METVHAYARTSHRYIDEFKHLDGEKFVATVRLTAPKVTSEGNGYDDRGSYVQYLRVPRNVDKKELARALRDTMGYSGCTHEYDCCGCTSHYVWVESIGPRTMRVKTNVARNY
jgi:hypothetical protein